MKYQEKNYDYLYEVMLKEITVYGIHDLGKVIVIRKEDENGNPVEPIRVIGTDEEIFEYDSECFLSHPMSYRYVGSRKIDFNHPTMTEVKFVDGANVYPSPMDKEFSIFAVDKNDFKKENYATLDMVVKYLSEEKENPFEKRLENKNNKVLSLNI